MIIAARERSYHAVNTELIKLYWNIGSYISKRIDQESWGKGVVEELSKFLRKEEPGLNGFSSRNLWRMRQFYDSYQDQEILSPLVTELTWTNNLIILSRTKDLQEREFYLRLAIRDRLSKRDLQRTINTSSYERTMIGEQKLSPVATEFDPQLASIYKDTYILDFLDLPENHSEKDLQKAILANIKSFILELGNDFTFVGEEYRLQVGNTDFFVDLLFYHRDLRCLVPIELKIDKFQPEFLGKMNFYLEALDRDVKKSHENPSIGIILCMDKDDEVVEYAMNRNISPTLVSEYQTKLIPKGKLRRKLKELFSQSNLDKEE